MNLPCTIRLISRIAGLGLFSLFASGQSAITSPQAKTPTQITSANVTIVARGVVTDTLTHRPIPEALVYVDRLPPLKGPNQLIHSNGASHEEPERRSASNYSSNTTEPTEGQQQLTDANGGFEFQVSKRGHMFYVTKPGYLTATPNRRIEFSEYEIRMDIIRRDPKIEELKLSLAPEAHVTGTIVADDGHVIGNAPIAIYQKLVDDGRPVWKQIGDGSTNARGSYSYSGLAAGTYIVISGWMLDLDPDKNLSNGFSRNVGCSSPGPFMPQSGYAPTASPGVLDFALAKPIVLTPGMHAVGDLKLKHQPFHSVTIGNASGTRNGSYDFTDRNDRNLEMPRDYRNNCIRLMPQHYDPVTGRRTINLPDGSYTLHISGEYATNYPLQGGETKQPVFLDGYASFKVAGTPLTVPAPQVHAEDRASTTIHIRRDLMPLNIDGSAPNACRGNEPRVNIDTDPGTLPPRPAPVLTIDLISLSRADALPMYGMQPAPTAQTPDLFEFHHLAPGRYWLHISGVDNGYVAAATANGVDLSTKPLIVGMDGTSAPIEITLRNDCGILHAEFPRSKIPQETLGVQQLFYGELVPLFPAFSGRRSITFGSEQGTNIFVSDLAPGHYKFYLVRRQKAFELPLSESVQKALGPGQDVWLKPDGKTDVIITEPPVE